MVIREEREDYELRLDADCWIMRRSMSYMGRMRIPFNRSTVCVMCMPLLIYMHANVR